MSGKKTNALKTTERAPQLPFLVVMAGPRFGETFPLKEGDNVVGSAPEASFSFLTTLLSERHFLITCRKSRVELKALEGATFVNNASVKEIPLKDADMISAGGILLRCVAEKSSQHFYVGDVFYGQERRRYRRFSMISTADAYLPEKDQRLEVLSVRSVGRGGVGLFCKETVPLGVEIAVSLYSKNADRVIVAESIGGIVVSMTPWKDSLVLLNVSFHQPISPENQPHLHQHLDELERFF
jgi:hypothetical protein